MDLPDWRPGTVVAFATDGDGPHLVPVSAALRAGPRLALVALARGRGSLARLRADPRVAVMVLAGPDLAFTAFGAARVVDESLVEGVVAVAVDVDRIQDHGRPTFQIEAGVTWHWTDAEAGSRDALVRAALARLAARLGGG